MNEKIIFAVEKIAVVISILTIVSGIVIIYLQKSIFFNLLLEH